jgi:hypothetical protein
LKGLPPDLSIGRGKRVRDLLGLLKGKIVFHQVWDETPEEFKPYME